MRKITLQITEDLCTALGLTTGADESALALAITTAAKKVTTLTTDLATERETSGRLQTELTTLKAQSSKSAIKALLDPANESGKVTNELRAQLEKDYATNPEGLKTLLGSMGAYTSITEAIEQSKGKDMGKYAGKTWDQLMDANLLEAFKAEFPIAFKQLHKETFEV